MMNIFIRYFVQVILGSLKIVLAIFILTLAFREFYPSILGSELAFDVKTFLDKKNNVITKAPPTEDITFEEKHAENIGSKFNRDVIYIKTAKELTDHINNANKENKPKELVLYPGEYMLSTTLDIKTDGMIIRSLELSPMQTVLKGSKGIGNLIKVFANDIRIDSVHLTDSELHLVQIAGENKASRFVMENCILSDSGQQMLKISYDKNLPNNYSTDGIIKNSYFYFSSGYGKSFYVGGIDGHAARYWTIDHNIFKDIASPSSQVAEYAIHFWNNSAFNTISENLIINSDRGIGLGLGRPTDRNVLLGDFKSIVRGNVIASFDVSKPFSDVGIALEAVFGSVVENNTVYLANDYPRSIEFRFPETTNVVITGNNINKRVSARDGGKALIEHSNSIIDKKFALKAVGDNLQLSPHKKSLELNLQI